MREILADHNLPEVDWGGKKELYSTAIRSEIVITKISQQQQCVGGAQGKREFGSMCEYALISSGATKNKQHEHRHNQGEQHWSTAAEIAELLFEDRSDWSRQSRHVPSALERFSFRPRNLTSDRFAEILPAILSTQTKIQQ